MASKRPTGDSTVYNKFTNNQETEIEIDLLHRTTNPLSNSSSTPVSQRIIRRRNKPRPQPRLPAKAMSLVGLKNLFFHKTITPVSRKAQPSPVIPFNDASGQPLLSANNRSYSNTPNGQRRAIEESGDVESLNTANSISNKSSKKGFRIDARVISDATIGLSDGLTVPFALTAGLSALGNTKVVIYGGFAELIAGAISMGVGGYLGAKSEADSYNAQREEAQRIIASKPMEVKENIADVFEPYDLPEHLLKDITNHLANSPRLVDFVMRFEHCTEEPASSRALTSAATIALAYFVGGLLPLIPYIFVGAQAVYTGLYISIGVMIFALFLFGYGKKCAVVGWEGGRNIRSGCWGGIQMVLMGGAAAAAAMGLVRLFNQNDGI